MISANVTRSRREMFERAYLIRTTEQRLLDLFAQDKLFGTIHTCIGQEFSGLSIAAALKPGDIVFSNHRCHGHFIACTGNVEGLLAEVMGRSTGVCGGRGGSQHLYSPGFYSNGVLGGTAPVAAGIAYALKLKKSKSIAISFLGDGALGEGVLYETLNFASKWELPILFVLENNRIAQSTPQAQTLAGSILNRALAFGIASAQTNVWDLDKLLSASRNAVSHVRQKHLPFFLQIDCDRLMAHSKGDDSRSPAETKRYWERDPLKIFSAENPKDAAQFEIKSKARLDDAFSRVDAAAYSVPMQMNGDPMRLTECRFRPAPQNQKEYVSALLHDAFERNMKLDKRILMLGEDIEAPYGGAFKTTRTLNRQFPGRVRNTPISEAGFLGLGCGLALQGFIPVIEIMFGDFMTLAADQWTNSAAKFRYMYNDKVQVPLIVRAPMGGRRGYGPTHSQSLEKHFLGIPQTLVLALNSGHDPGQLYDTLFRSIDRPALVIENKLLYSAKIGPITASPGFQWELSDETYPTVRVRPEGTADITLFCYGGMLPLAQEAAIHLFAQEEIALEIICPEQLYPFNLWPLLDSVRRTGRLLIAEEGQGFAAMGSEIIALLIEREVSSLKAVRRVSAACHPIPSSGVLEKKALPQSEDIQKAAKELIHA